MKNVIRLARERLASVLCDSNGAVCCAGSNSDRAEIAVALYELEKEAAQFEADAGERQRMATEIERLRGTLEHVVKTSCGPSGDVARKALAFKLPQAVADAAFSYLREHAMSLENPSAKDCNPGVWHVFSVGLPDGGEFGLGVSDNVLRIRGHEWIPVEVQLAAGGGIYDRIEIRRDEAYFRATEKAPPAEPTDQPSREAAMALDDLVQAIYIADEHLQRAGVTHVAAFTTYWDRVHRAVLRVLAAKLRSE